MSSYPEIAADALRRAGQLHDEERWEEAIGAYREALQAAPKDASVHYNLGLALHETGRRAAAMAHYREALRLRPDHAETHLNLGTALYENGQLEEAVEAFQSALTLEPLTDAYYNLGLVHQDLEHYPEAVVAFQKYLQFDQDSDWAAEARENIAAMRPLLPTQPDGRMGGTVKWFNASRGFGFIAPDNGIDEVFVHRKHLRSPRGGRLMEGQRVEFTVEETARGLQAVEVDG
jgi:cold shock CspA family protein/cytochrome c-type biogenesis protein CcmH/NrfG